MEEEEEEEVSLLFSSALQRALCMVCCESELLLLPWLQLSQCVVAFGCLYVSFVEIVVCCCCVSSHFAHCSCLMTVRSVHD